MNGTQRLLPFFDDFEAAIRQHRQAVDQSRRIARTLRQRIDFWLAEISAMMEQRLADQWALEQHLREISARVGRVERGFCQMRDTFCGEQDDADWWKRSAGEDDGPSGPD